MQNFTGTGFSNNEIKKEDIVKQIKSKGDAIMSLREMHLLFLKASKASVEQGGYITINESRSKRAAQEAEKFTEEFIQLKKQMEEYLDNMPHD